MSRQLTLKKENGMSLVEVLIVVFLLGVSATGITEMLVSTMGAQQKIDAEFNAQQDVRQAEYEMEKTFGEAKRTDSATNQEPVFQSDLVSVPTQNNNWATYYFTIPPGADGPTIVKITTSTRPTIPPTVLNTDKQMINVRPNTGIQSTVVDRVNGGPIFTYFKNDGTQIMLTGQSIAIPRDVRSIQVNFRITVREGHILNDPVIALTRINLRNY